MFFKPMDLKSPCDFPCWLCRRKLMIPCLICELLYGLFHILCIDDFPMSRWEMHTAHSIKMMHSSQKEKGAVLMYGQIKGQVQWWNLRPRDVASSFLLGNTELGSLPWMFNETLKLLHQNMHNFLRGFFSRFIIWCGMISDFDFQGIF